MTDRYDWIDRALLAALTLSGLLTRPRVWYPALLTMFAVIAVALLGGAGLVTLASARVGRRIQGPRTRSALIWRGALDTTRAAWVAACLAAWPLTLIRIGQPTGLTWKLPGSPLWLTLQTISVLLAMDAWLYWKHRLLHTRFLFPFHRDHHVYRDPTAFAGFAVGPVESLLTFWPILLLCIPAATHYGPLYFGLVIAFVLLNFYLHCGVAVRWVEAILPRVFSTPRRSTTSTMRTPTRTSAKPSHCGTTSAAPGRSSTIGLHPRRCSSGGRSCADAILLSVAGARVAVVASR
jgi:lathosterol oxidase